MSQRDLNTMSASSEVLLLASTSGGSISVEITCMTETDCTLRQLAGEANQGALPGVAGAWAYAEKLGRTGGGRQ